MILTVLHRCAKSTRKYVRYWPVLRMARIRFWLNSPELSGINSRADAEPEVLDESLPTCLFGSFTQVSEGVGNNSPIIQTNKGCPDHGIFLLNFIQNLTCHFDFSVRFCLDRFEIGWKSLKIYLFIFNFLTIMK